MDAFCAKCGRQRNVDAQFCNSCGHKFNDSLIPASEPTQVLFESTTSDFSLNTPKSDAGPKKALLIFAGALVALALIFAAFGKGSSTDSSSTAADTSAQSSQSSVDSQYYVFSNEEAITFWNDRLGVDFNQKDRWIRIGFPSTSDNAYYFSAPYYQLIIYPTWEKYDEDRENIKYDVYNDKGRDFIACSNVVLVFPESQSPDINSINDDEFCKE